MDEERAKLVALLNDQGQSQQMKQSSLKKCLSPAYGCHYSQSMVNMIFSNKEVPLYQSIESSVFIEEWLSKYTIMQNLSLIKAFKPLDREGNGLIKY